MSTTTPQIAQRVAIVLAGVFVLGALAATFLPTSPEGATCGNWVSPEWDDETTRDLVDEYQELASGDGTDSPELSRLRGEATGSAMAIVRSKRLCDDALGTRQTMTFVLLGLAVIAPVGIVFIAGARRD